MRPPSPERARALEKRRRYLERKRRREAKKADSPRSAESSAEKQPKINPYGCAAAVLLTCLSAAAFIIWAVMLPNAPAESDAPDNLGSAEDIGNASGRPVQTQERSLLIALPSANADGKAWSTKRRQERIPKGNANRLKLVAEVWTSAMAEAGGIDPSTELLSAYMDEKNQAYLNFTGGFADSLNKGLTREMEIVISLAKTIRENLPTAKRATLLVEGNELDPNASQLRLSGPIDLVFYAELDDAL